jgi:hypothetical protein
MYEMHIDVQGICWKCGDLENLKRKCVLKRRGNYLIGREA